MNELSVHSQFNDDNYRLKFPTSIKNSKSMFINVTLIIVCVIMLFDFNIYDSNLTVGNARNLYAVNVINNQNKYTNMDSVESNLSNNSSKYSDLKNNDQFHEK